MALAIALLLIGSSLSFKTLRPMLVEIVSIGALKLLALLLVGYFLMIGAKVPDPLILPGVILLASPPATISHVMAMELGGAPMLAATSVFVFTPALAVSYAMILSWLMSPGGEIERTQLPPAISSSVARPNLSNR